MGGVFVFKANKSILFSVVCSVSTLGAYHSASTLKLAHPTIALIVGGAISTIVILNYIFFEFYVTKTGITFCSHKTFFSRKYLPLSQVMAYKFHKTGSGTGTEIRAEIYDRSRNIFSSFIVGKQDAEFASAMQELEIPILDFPVISKRQRSPY